MKPLSLPAVRRILEGREPVEDLQCHVFNRRALPVVRSVEGTMEVAADDVPAFRRTMHKRGVGVAEVDRDLRYVWIDNPHPDFDSGLVVGKRDDELIDANDAAEIMSVKHDVLEREKHVSRVLRFRRSDGWRCYGVSVYPIRSREGVLTGVLTVGVDSSFMEVPAAAIGSR